MFDYEEYYKDLEKQYVRIDLHRFDNKNILVTGSCGLICSYLIDLLMYANNKHDANIKVYALSRSKDKLENRFDKYIDNDKFIPIIQDVCEPIKIDKVDYIIHGASNATPKLYIEKPVDTMNANYLGMLNIMNLAKENKSKVLYISSGDVYGERNNNNEPLTEKDYAYIDILNVRASYASSKRATETLCISYKEQYGMNVSIVRPAHIYGPTFTLSDTRAISDFMRNVLEDRDIIMKSDGSSIRSYCYVGDAVIGILLVMLDGENGEAYNISNANSFVSIKEVANIICKKYNKKLIIELPKDYWCPSGAPD